MATRLHWSGPLRQHWNGLLRQDYHAGRIVNSASGAAAVTLANLSPSPGSNKARKRVGRGMANGGRTCGRGHKGQKSRSGPGIPRGFAGGQTRLVKTTPKYGGCKNPNKKELVPINLDRIQRLIDIGRIDATKPITLSSFYNAGIKDFKDGIKIMARGKEFFASRICIMATEFSADAIARIEELGGLAIAVHHDAVGIRALKRPASFKLGVPPFAPPKTHRDCVYYTSFDKRGYLSPRILAICQAVDPTFTQRHIIQRPVYLQPHVLDEPQ